MAEPNQSPDEPADRETVVSLPAREALSIVDGGSKMLPLGGISPEPVDPPNPNPGPAVSPEETA